MENKYKIGDLVKLSSPDEVGVVIWVWYNEEIYNYDYYIAFFGERFPSGKPKKKPYVLRYAETSLTLCSQSDTNS